jgi:hypothetical protein
MATQDTALHLGVEGTYGTKATLSRSFEVLADDFSTNVENVMSDGFRAGKQTHRSNNFATFQKGGSGSVELDFRSEGTGLLLDGLLGASVAPTLVGAATAYKQTYTSTVGGSSDSYSIQMVRGTTSGTQVFDYLGCVPTGFEFSNSVDEFLKMNIDFDVASVATGASAATAAYVDTGVQLHWQHAAITVDGDTVCPRSWSFSGDLAVDTDRYRLCSNGVKSQPARVGTAEYSGSFEIDFEDLTLYTDMVQANVVPIVFTYQADEIETGFYHELKITLPACRINNANPTANNGDYSSLAVDFGVLHNGTDDAVKIELTSTETSI